MADLPRLNEPQIQQWIGDVSFRRGERYYRQGRILNPRRQAETLKALCSGSQPEPYRVEMLLSPQGIVSGHCSCPVGGRGRCKHAAALLLTWLHEPETFHEIEDLETSLLRRSKDDLVALIFKMIGRYPSLVLIRPVILFAGDRQGSVHKVTLCRSTSWASEFGNALR